MEPEKIAGGIKHYWIVLVVLILIGAVGGYVTASRTAPTYRSTASGLIAAELPKDAGQSVSGSAIVVGAIAPTLVEMSTSDSVLSQVSEATGEDATALKGVINVSNPTGTLLLEVTATGSSPEKAQAVAEAELDALNTASGEMHLTTGTESGTLTVTTVDEASLSDAPVSPSHKRFMIVGVIVGGLVGLITVIVLENRRVRRERSGAGAGAATSDADDEG